MEPANQKVSIGAFDNAGTVVMPAFQRKDELADKLILSMQRGGRKDDRKAERDAADEHGTTGETHANACDGQDLIRSHGSSADRGNG